MTGILVWMLPASGQAQSLGLYPAAAASADADRLSDAEELTLGTNPSLADTDGDFITDSDELLITGTNPLLADSDMDGLTDYEEWVVLIPRLWDVDKNGMLDIEPLQNTPPGGYSPLNGGDIWWITAHLTDFDGEGLSDRDEIIFGNLTRYHYNRAYVDWPNGEGETYDYESWARPNHWEPTDYDRDGLNAAEEVLLQTDPNDPDTDGDGLEDGLDSIFGDPLLVDTDSDGVSDHDELMYYSYAYPYIEFFTEEDLAVAIQTALGSSALGFILDWDGDGMSNVWEIAHGLNPVNTLDAYDDPDGDFLFNLEEYQARTDPNAALSMVSQSVTIQVTDSVTQLPQTRAVLNDYEAVTGLPLPAGMVRDNGPLSIHDYDDDWDGDGYGNRDELLGVHVRDPRYNDVLDTDGDGLFDTWETLKGLDKNDADEDADSLSDGADDFDNDNLTNLGEQAANTNPLLADTDSDSLPDGWEVAKGLNALNADQDGDNLTDDADNFDLDLLTNAQELAAGTHPRYSDTDWDGLRDDWELANLLNPLSSAGIHGGSGDADGDGFSNAAEQTAGSSPQSAGSTPPATFIFKSWAAEGEGEGDTPGNYEGFVRSLAGPEQERDFPYTPHNQPIPKANEAALWTETTIKALDYAGASVTPWTSYNPAQSPGGDVRWVGLIPHFVAVKADFEWLGYDFRSNYRRVRLEAQKAVGAAETRTYLVFTETEVTNSLQVVGKVEFTLPAGETKASVTVDSALNQYGLSVAADGKTLCIEPPPPPLTVHGFFKRSVYLLPVDIEPDANMAGVVGDVVKSAKAGSTVEHFVTPKKSTELNQDYVVLKAVGVTAEQITDGNANQIVQWDGGLPTDPPEPLKRRVKRDATGTGPTEVKIKAKQGGAVAAQMNVWVVWGGAGRFERKPTQPVILGNTSRTNIAGDASVAVTVEPDRPWLMVFAIEPKSMFDKTAEVPDLMGTVQPSGLTGNHPILNNGQATLDGGANRHWDVSRQFKETITNNGGIAKGLFPDGAGALYANQPKANQADVAVNFPTDSITGNDDTGVIDEINDPYNPTSAGTYQTKQGEVLSHDAPKLFMTIKGLKAGEGMTDYAEFKEFVRLNVGRKWFRASDFLDFNIKLQFTMDADLQNVTLTGTNVSPK
ncbi:hypothetical protein GCM10023213_44100 [Prosthecobacter algae]|uniref:Uncharacterized protein n=1 Tax=Prosthecobacter algae TaxID=1144682 RepID=A0ABP9PKU0_9BACT